MFFKIDLEDFGLSNGPVLYETLDLLPFLESDLDCDLFLMSRRLKLPSLYIFLECFLPKKS